MASISFPHPNPSVGRQSQFSGRRLSVLCATAVRTPPTAVQTASFYEVLGLRPGATCQEIKSAYRKMARVMHPDAVSDGRGDAADGFIRLQAAYATLSDPAKRALYDRSLLRLRPMATVGGGPELTRRRRSWETDQCW